ncbi:hypothetical protein L6452_43860 [Arctium lappa]|uniref:Uncharacterized protein n=1 Tax=Arctium lappa TaxID=4217 RepID=A0ACB8XEL6_ARCLA|nr:hypothetical protein L6452_43860 [Arctium lappa]
MCRGGGGENQKETQRSRAVTWCLFFLSCFFQCAAWWSLGFACANAFNLFVSCLYFCLLFIILVCLFLSTPESNSSRSNQILSIQTHNVMYIQWNLH